MTGASTGTYPENMTTNPPRQDTSVFSVLRMVFWTVVLAWLGWIAVVSYVALWMYWPDSAVVVTTVTVLTAVWVVYRLLVHRRQQRKAYEERMRMKQEYQRQNQLRRAQEFPEIVFEENAQKWAEEFDDA